MDGRPDYKVKLGLVYGTTLSSDRCEHTQTELLKTFMILEKKCWKQAK